MLKILFALGLFTTSLLIAQVPSSTKKWNDLDKRYDYFDSERTLVGYEKYNAYTKQWEYFSKSDENKRQPKYRSNAQLEYPTLSSSDIEYARAVAQNNSAQDYNDLVKYHNENFDLIQNKVDYYISLIKNLEVSQDVKDKMINAMSDKVDIGNKRFTDFSKKSVTDAAFYFYRDSYNEILEKYYNAPIRERRKKVH